MGEPPAVGSAHAAHHRRKDRSSTSRSGGRSKHIRKLLPITGEGLTRATIVWQEPNEYNAAARPHTFLIWLLALIHTFLIRQEPNEYNAAARPRAVMYAFLIWPLPLKWQEPDQ